MSPEKEITEQEKKFLEKLFQYTQEIHGDRWKKVLKRGLNIPEKGFKEKFQLHINEKTRNEEKTIKKLEEKALIEIETVTEEVDTSKREVTYSKTEEGLSEREIEDRGRIRGEREKKKLKMPDIEEIAGKIEVKE
ncbi:MAG: hypothetical protein ABEJ87_01355 [Candidatus Nanohalobium sp.]